MGPTNIPRRYIWIAAGAAGAAAYMILRDRLNGMMDDEAGDAGERAHPGEKSSSTAQPSPSPASAASDSAEEPEAATEAGEPLPAGVSELAAFLAGESWFDESGWRGLWEREGIDDAAAWLRETGFKTLMEQRAKLQEHPALLAGCRRRWIVVARYGGMEVAEATDLWNKSDK